MKQLGGFTLLERLGKGADGDVWKVKDSDGALSALKFCPVSETNSTFHIEFQRLKRINIDGVINVHACGEENGLAYYSMDLIIGSNLRDYANALPAAPDRFEQLFRIFAKITLVLSQLHQMGITHLDVKPENIIIQENGEPTLLDFGRAVALGERRTQHGSFVYMSPEQRSHFPCTEKSDVYSIAVTMVEILTGQAPPHTQIGTPWKPLFHYSRKLSLECSGAVQQALSIVASQRPSMKTLHQVCQHSVESKHVPHQFYPRSTHFIGNYPDLTEGNHILLGNRGSGRTRIIQENIRQWYHEGHQSFVGFSSPTHPFQPWTQILDALLLPLSPKEREKRIINEADILKRIHPKLPIPKKETVARSFTIEEIARSIAKVLQRSDPVAIIIFDIEKMDIGSLKILKFLWQYDVSNFRIWGTSTKKIAWATCYSPPPWSPAKDQRFLQSFLPKHIQAPLNPPAKTPLQSQIKAWQAVAKALKEPHIQKQPPTKDILPLALLDEPFPREIALQLSDNIELFLQAKILVEYPSFNQFCFAFYPQKLLALQTKYSPKFHEKIQFAWKNSSQPSRGLERIIHHAYLSRSLQDHLLIEALRHAIERIDASDIFRYFNLIENLELTISNFWIEYARNYLVLNGFTGRLNLSFLKEQQELSKKQDVLKNYLLILYHLQEQDINAAKRLTEKLINEQYSILPNICLSAVQKIALMYLNTGQLKASLDISQKILSQIQVTQEIILGYVNINITLSAALIYDLQLSKALELIESLQPYVAQIDSFHHRIALLINKATAEFQLGKRHLCLHTLLLTRELLEEEEHLTGQAYCSFWEARLAIETGDVSAGLVKLRESIVLAQNVNDEHLLAEAWTLLLNAATHQANPVLANEAIENYEFLTLEHRHDHWPAAFARWQWLSGRLTEALETLDGFRLGFGHFLNQNEKLRILIVLGQYQEARSLHEKLIRNPLLSELKEMDLFLKMCNLVLKKESGSLFPSHSWIELDLGQWHLLAISDRLQGKDITLRLQTLHKKAKSSGHQLYIALGDPRFW